MVAISYHAGKGAPSPLSLTMPGAQKQRHAPAEDRPWRPAEASAAPQVEADEEGAGEPVDDQMEGPVVAAFAWFRAGGRRLGGRQLTGVDFQRGGHRQARLRRGAAL